MKLDQWFKIRGPKYVKQRAALLAERYGISPVKAQNRVWEGVRWLADLGCLPTFPVPAMVIRKNPQYFQRLQESGVELCVHGFSHVALAQYSAFEAAGQLVRAAGIFKQYGIAAQGLRCPYLSCTSELLSALPPGLFEYSSNLAVAWDVIARTQEHISGEAIGEVLERVYQPEQAGRMVCAPFERAGVIEIPVCLPDDLELHDVFGLDPAGMGEVWGRVLEQTHARGELFVLMYHPELMDRCQQPLTAVITRAAALRPAVWMARLRDISAWWKEKAGFSVQVLADEKGLSLSFTCSERAAILARGIEPESTHQPWDETYHRVTARTLRISGGARPLLGVEPGAQEHTLSFLKEQGYILDTGQTAAQCAVYLDIETLNRRSSPVELIRYIEQTRGPLVKFGRWPNGNKSALSITGDLDALSLMDYAERLFVR
ncbi:MAG: polysaccharide deacetylase family protein [Anaerolineaceae bacterium]